MMLKITPLLTAAAALLSPAAAQAPPRTKVIAYVPNWIDVNAFAETIEYGKLTHINIAFENPTNDVGDLSFNGKNSALIERAQAAGVKVLISIGGGAAADNKTLKERYFKLISEPNRAAFAARLANYVVAHKFDGLDVDVEGPSINADYGPFIDELAKALKPRGKLLTAALSKGYGGPNVPDSVFPHFDWINVMAYDGTGPWNRDRPGQHSSYGFAKESVDYWLKRGLAKGKAVLGVPFYGYGFGDAYRNYGYPYSEVLRLFPGADQLDEVGATVYHNSIPTIRAKSKYVVEEGLGGVMIWSLDQDVTGAQSLLTAIHEAVQPKPVAETK